jgi:hypothetical protein
MAKDTRHKTVLSVSASTYPIGGDYSDTAYISGTLKSHQLVKRRYRNIAKSGIVLLETTTDGSLWTLVDTAYTSGGSFGFQVTARGGYRVRFEGNKLMKPAKSAFSVSQQGQWIGAGRVTDVKVTEDGDYRVGVAFPVEMPAGTITTITPAYMGLIALDEGAALDLSDISGLESNPLAALRVLHFLFVQKVVKNGSPQMAFTVPSESADTTFSIAAGLFPTAPYMGAAIASETLSFKVSALR